MALLQVQTKSGMVEGIPAGNQMISLFRGIPYAEAPVGELRWKRPVPVKPWEGTLECYKFKSICWQERQASEGGDDIIANEFYCVPHPRSEDCLYLNIWTPARSADENLPVAVYLHGGGYSTGYGFLNCYDGEGMAKRGIVYVTVTHRLNIFGFLAHPELSAEDPEGSSGNYGMFDIIEALKWIQENISCFGGNPDQITIFGQSGGGGKVQTLVCSPISKDMVQGAIMQSGGGLCEEDDLPRLKEAEEEGKQLLEGLGLHSIAEARAMDPETLMYKAVDWCSAHGKRFMGLWHPVIDNVLLKESPRSTILNGRCSDIPYMVGCTAGEFFRPLEKLPGYEELLETGRREFGEEKAQAFADSIHLEDEETARATLSNRFGEHFAAHVLAWNEHAVRTGNSRSYSYYLTLVPPGTKFAHHSAEHYYVFQTLQRNNRAFTGRDYDLSNQLCDYWSNFIKYGDPNGLSNGQSVGVPLPHWDPVTENNEAMIIDYDLHMAPVPVSDYRRFITDQILEEQ